MHDIIPLILAMGKDNIMTAEFAIQLFEDFTLQDLSFNREAVQRMLVEEKKRERRLEKELLSAQESVGKLKREYRTLLLKNDILIAAPHLSDILNSEEIDVIDDGIERLLDEEEKQERRAASELEKAQKSVKELEDIIDLLNVAYDISGELVKHVNS